MNVLWYNWLLFISVNLKLHQWIIMKPHHQTLKIGPVKVVLPPPLPPPPLLLKMKFSAPKISLRSLVMIGMWVVVLQATRTSCLSIKNKTVSVSTGTFQVSKMRWYYNTAIHKVMSPSVFLRLIEAVEDTYNWGFHLVVLLVWSPVLLRNEDKFLVCLYRLPLPHSIECVIKIHWWYCLVHLAF